MPVILEYDPSRQTRVIQRGLDAGRTVKRYSHQPCEHPITLTPKITLWAGTKAVIPTDHWNEYLNHPNPNVRNKIIPQQLKDGTLRVVEVLDDKTEVSSLISQIDNARAVDLIENTFDAAMLDLWAKEDDRPAVLRAIEGQKAAIKREAGIDAKATTSKTAKN